MSYDCLDCGLPDLHNGDGDGIGSCYCPRCEYCGWPPGTCHCECDDCGWLWTGDDAEVGT